MRQVLVEAMSAWSRALEPMRAMVQLVWRDNQRMVQQMQQVVEQPFRTMEPFLRHWAELARTFREMQIEMARREPSLLLPTSEQLIAKLPEESPLRRWKPKKPVARDFDRAGWQFHRLPKPCREYLVLLGLVGELAEAETHKPGYYDRLRGGWADEESRDASRASWLALWGTLVISEAPSQQQKLLWTEALFLALLGFRARECPGDSRSGPHRWLASPMSRAKVGCPVHGNAIRTRRSRSGLARPRKGRHKGWPQAPGAKEARWVVSKRQR
jgi:hypothetical protein